MSPADPSRRRLLVQALATAGVVSPPPARAAAALPEVANVTGLYTVTVARIEVPPTLDALRNAVRAWPGRIGIGGGRYSMGGQVAIEGGLHIDMRMLDRLVWLRRKEKTVRVQAGMRWRDLQDLLDPLDLAVHTMQSYANFTVGGSVSVNAHGRYVGHGPIANSVRALRLVLADGSVRDTDRARDPELFRAAIGGYGAVGVIVEVELDLADNVRIERVVTPTALADYPAHFDAAVRGDPDTVLHNADLLPPAFDRAVGVSWRRTDKALTRTARLVPRDGSYGLEQNVLWAVTELPGGAKVRRDVIHPKLLRPPVVQWLKHEASLDVAVLDPRTRVMSTYVLLEYFVPRRHFESFARQMGEVLRRHGVEAVNVSVRHSPADTVSLLPWAKEEVFSFVLYHKQRTWASAREAVGVWTRELVDCVIAHEGRWYLPYQPHATRAQFERAYPEVADLRRVKAQVDPAGRLSNALWAKYL
ncbi:MAG: FAD-binding oxidoreductase [Rhizobacter sp.]